MSISKAWRYFGPDRVAREGSFVYAPLGVIPTLVVDEVASVRDVITHFNIHGAMVYLDAEGNHTSYEDVSLIQGADDH